MIRYDKNQVILSGKTEKSFANKLHRPERAKMIQRDIYIKDLRKKLNIKAIDGKIYIE